MSSLTDHIDPNQIVSSNLNMSSWLSFVWSSTQLNLLTNQKKLFCFFTKTLLSQCLPIFSFLDQNIPIIFTFMVVDR